MLDSNLVFHVLIAFGAFQALFMASIILLQGPKHLAKHFFLSLSFFGHIGAYLGATILPLHFGQRLYV